MSRFYEWTLWYWNMIITTIVYYNSPIIWFGKGGHIVYRSVCIPSDVGSISFNLFAWKCPNIVQWMPLVRRFSRFVFELHGQRSRCLSLYKCCPLNIFDPFAWQSRNGKSVKWKPLESGCSLLMFRSDCQSSRSDFYVKPTQFLIAL